MRRKSYKKAFLSSFLVMLFCFAMLLGTTFAWFTKNVSTSVSTIQSGNLKVKLQYVAQLPNAPAPDLSDDNLWQDAGNTVPLFDETALWEPGYTGIVYLRVVNDGNLALKYQYRINITDNTLGRSASGQIDLTEYLKLKVVEKTDNAAYTQATAIEEMETEQYLKDKAGLQVNSEGAKIGVVHEGASNERLLPGTSENTSGVIAVIVHMPGTVGNAANPASAEDAPSLTLSFDVAATQYNHESDSFGPNYDASAPDATYETVQPESGE